MDPKGGVGGCCGADEVDGGYSDGSGGGSGILEDGFGHEEAFQRGGAKRGGHPDEIGRAHV